MTDRFWRILSAGLARFLDPKTKDVVIGDLEELNLGSSRSVCELCGLIARQQVSVWKDWRPWLALLGIVGLVGIRLTLLAGTWTGLPIIYIRTYRAYGVIYQSGLTLNEEFIVWFTMAAAIILWSWTAGFAFVSLAHKTALITGAFLCTTWLGLNAFMLGLILLRMPWWFAVLLPIPSIFFFAPALWGARRAFRRGSLSFAEATVLLIVTSGITALVTWTSGWPQAGVERWSEGALHGGTPWYGRLLSYVLLSWPAVWIASSSGRPLNGTEPKHRLLF